MDKIVRELVEADLRNYFCPEDSLASEIARISRQLDPSMHRVLELLAERIRELETGTNRLIMALEREDDGSIRWWSELNDAIEGLELASFSPPPTSEQDKPLHEVLGSPAERVSPGSTENPSRLNVDAVQKALRQEEGDRVLGEFSPAYDLLPTSEQEEPEPRELWRGIKFNQDLTNGRHRR